MSDTCQLLQAEDEDHIFAAILTATGNAPGLNYLRIKLYQQLQAQLRLQNGAAAAMPASIAALDAAYRRLHPFHGDIMEGVSLTMVYVDSVSNAIYLASTGGAGSAASSSSDSQSLHVTGRHQSSARKQLDVEVLPLDRETDCIVLGSAGLW